LSPIPGIGPSSSRVISELLATGGSPSVERAVDESGKREDITRRRTLRSHFLSRAAVLEVLASDRGETAAVTDCLGDFQMHSDWSDGGSTLAEMADACAARGYQFLAMTDHAHSLRIAGGMSMERARAQQKAIDRLNARRGTCLILKGIEANIGPDGQLDLSGEETREFEFVLAAPHSKLRLAEDQTERMLTAVSAPHTHALAHPRGRVSSTRAGVIADWDRVFARAAQLNVAIELDGDPSRQDVDYALAARALRAGCVFTLSSDAHSPDQLVYIETAIAHARLARIPRSRILNCWQREEVLQWIHAKNNASRAPVAQARNKGPRTPG
jgi:histidinol phosphatase-like PHP family hydrolase